MVNPDLHAAMRIQYDQINAEYIAQPMHVCAAMHAHIIFDRRVTTVVDGDPAARYS